MNVALTNEERDELKRLLQSENNNLHFVKNPSAATLKRMEVVKAILVKLMEK